jgi:nucleoside-diphosphate-sugar epimerase
MDIFITGATGYIGLNVAKTFRRKGHKVFGLTRSKEKMKNLVRNEITPILGWLEDPGSYKRVAEECDLIIHTASDDLVNPATFELQTTKILVDITRISPRPQLMIYTGGTWVYGNSPHQSLTENSPLHPIQMFEWQPQAEEMVLDGDGIVLRPGVIYGRSGGLTGAWFKGTSNGGVTVIIGDGHNRWPMIHVDDLAEGYLLAAQADQLGEEFNLVDSSTNTVMEMASAAAKTAGNIQQLEFIPLEEAIKEIGPMAEALAIDQMVDATKARRMLHWEPKHEGFIQEVGTYFRAWQASKL